MRAVLWIIRLSLVFLAGVAAQGGDACQQAGLLPDGPHAFGQSVAVDGDWAAVGAIGFDGQATNTGAVYIYHRNAGSWEFYYLLEGDGDLEYDIFGDSVALSLPFLAVGKQHDSDYGDWSGAAYVYELSTSEPPIFRGKLTAQDAHEYQRLGYSIDIEGDRLVAGAPYDDGGGSVYVFERQPDESWVQAAKLQAPSGAGGRMGWCVGVSGDVVVAGAPYNATQGNYAGAVDVFERQSDGTWMWTALLVAHDGQPFTGFGYAAAVDNGVVAVGAADAKGNEMYTGAVYVFARTAPGTWVEAAKLTATDGELGDALGASVAIQGDTIVAGASAYTGDGPDFAGAMYVFTRAADGSWLESGKILNPDPQADDRFGYSVGLDGASAIASANMDDTVAPDAGAAYIFAVGPDEDGDGVMDACVCAADVNKDWTVDVEDLLTLLLYFGETDLPDDPDCNGVWGTQCAGDTDNDADVDLADLSTLLVQLGEVCP